MTESETEDEILARIETALQKIAAVGKPVGRGFDKPAVTRALDSVIGRLKAGLEPGGEPAKHGAVPTAPGAATQSTE